MRQATILCILVKTFVDFADIDHVFYSNLATCFQAEAFHYSLGVIREGMTYYFQIVEACLESGCDLITIRFETIEEVYFLTC